MSALHYLLLSTLLLSSISSSNLECVLESINSFRHIRKDNALSPSLQKSETNVINEGITKITAFIKSFGESAKEKNGKFEPITHEAVIQEFIAKNSLVLKEQQRRLCDQICVPFIVEMSIQRPVAVYFCERIISTKSDMIKFFLDNFDILATYFGLGFQASSIRLPVSFFLSNTKQSESVVKSFLEKQKLITTFKKDLDNMTTQMMGELEKFFKTNVKETLISNFKKSLDMEKTVKALLGKDTKHLKEKVTKLTIVFNVSLDGNKPSHIKGFKNALSAYSAGIKEDISSQAFRSLLDKVIASIDIKYPTHATQIENYVMAQCFGTLAKFSVSQPVRTCGSIIQPAFEFDSGLKDLFSSALDSPRFLKMINHFVQKNLMIFASNQLADIHGVAALIRKDITEQLMKIQIHLETIAKLYPAADAKIFAPLVWDLLKFVNRFNKETFEILRVIGAFEIYHKQILTRVFSSLEISELVNRFKKSLSEHFESNKIDLQVAEFREGLINECERQVTGSALKICIKSVQAFKVDRKLIEIRHSNAIYKYIVTMMKQSLDKLDTEMNEEFVLVTVAVESINQIVEYIDKKIETLNRRLPESIKSIKNKKIHRLLVQAMLVNIELHKDFDKEVWPVVRKWAEDHADYIAAYNLKDHSFEELADELAESLRASFSSELKLAKMSEHYTDLQSSHNRVTFNPSSQEIQDLKTKIYTLIKRYDSLPAAVKSDLAKCVLQGEDVKLKTEECAKKNNRDCVRFNPFLITPSCPSGFMTDSFGNCVESCPEGFGVSNYGFCAKPEIEFVGSVLGKMGTGASVRCPRNFTRVGIICIPRCPRSWEDHGNWCKRPFIKHTIDNDVLLIK